MSETPMKLVINLAEGTEQYVPLSADEIAQRDKDIAEFTTIATGERHGALAALRAKRDRYLAQTDVLLLDPPNWPTDMPQATKDAIEATRDQWARYRQQLRDYIATVVDPFDPPPFPVQPAAPAVILT